MSVTVEPASAKAANVAEIAENGRLTPVERLEALCDEGSLTLLRSDVVSKRMGAKARAGDGVIAGAGRVDGRPVFCYAQDPSYLGGSLGEQHADSIVRVLRLPGGGAAAGGGGVWAPGAPERRWSASSSPAAPGCRRDWRRWPATHASSASTSRSPAASRRSPSSAARPRAAAPTRRRSPTSW